MENFDFAALLRKNEAKHKCKPSQFVNVAGGVQKRLASNIKARKSNRITVFDSIRDLACGRSPSPVLSEAQRKVEHRRLQLEKWKEEKEKLKREAAAKKKKPFLAGASKYIPPPPPPQPSTSGRVTRSQAKASHAQKLNPPNPKANNASFAPKNATFNPPVIKSLAKLPTLAQPNNRSRKTKPNFTFEPVLPATKAPAAMPTRCKPLLTRQNAIEKTDNLRPKSQPKAASRTQTNTATRNAKAKEVTKPPVRAKPVAIPSSSHIVHLNTKRSLRSTKATQFTPPSSSSSEGEPSKVKRRVNTPRYPKAAAKKALTPKVLAIESTTTDLSSSESSCEKVDTRLRHVRNSVTMSTSDSAELTDDIPSVELNAQSNAIECRPKSINSVSTDCSVDECLESPILKPVSCHIRTPKTKIVPKSESNSEEKLRTPSRERTEPDMTPKASSSSDRFSKSPEAQKTPLLTPEQIERVMQFSPHLTVSRGKENARKEMQWKRDEGLLDEDTCEMASVSHFRKQLASEIERLTALCDKWDKISEQTVLPEPVQEQVLSAVGQARLLMSQKLQQFASLVECCAQPEPGAALVTPADLHGFWDMVFMAVVNVDVRFQTLEKLRARNWEEEVPEPVVVAKARPPARRPQTAKPAATSRIRDMIAAARKAKAAPSQPAAAPSPAAEERVFEAGFFSVRSPTRGSLPRTPRTSRGGELLRKVLSSEAKKASEARASRNSASFAMLRASLISRNLEGDGVAPLPLTPQPTMGQFATPVRSILKSSAKPVAESTKKSIKLVLFNDSNTDDDQDSSYTELHTQSSQDNGKQTELQVDSGTSSMDAEKADEEPEGAQPNPETPMSPMLTRRQRKSMQTTLVDGNSTVIEENSENIEIKTPRRSTRKSKRDTIDSEPVVKSGSKARSGRKMKTDAEIAEEKTPKSRRSKMKALEEIHANLLKEPTPRRVTRSRNT